MKKNHKILTIFLCLVMFFIAGCGDGGFGAGTEGSPVNLDGVKVMRKPAEYSISEIVGEENSEYFYNLFSKYMMQFLYMTYSYGIETTTEYRDDIILDTNLEEVFFGNSNNDKFFYYDSIRYSIESIEVNEVDGQLEIVLNINSAWNFGFDNYYSLESASEYPTLAIVNGNDILDVEYIEEANGKLKIIASYFQIENAYGTPGDYSSFYFGEDFVENNITMFGMSPYYQQYVLGEEVSVYNSYQDALEYVTYLFVLGYDYIDENGVQTEDADYFNLQISHTLTDTEAGRLNVPEITVARTPNGEVNATISEALDEIKARYDTLGTYIGLTDENKEQIVRFILDYVIGLDGETGDYDFNLTFLIDGGGNTPVVDSTRTRRVSINRDYQNVVTNIVNVACSQVRIGGSQSEGEVFIDTAYPISEVVDYKNDYFFTQWYDENGNTSDENILGHVESAEYQAMCLILPEAEVGSNLTDVALCFEYFDDGQNPDSELVYDEANGLTINVGINYYDSTSGEIVTSTAQKRVKYGRLMADADYHAGIDPDIRNVYFTTGDDVISTNPDKCVFKQIEPIPLNMQFNNNIDDGVLNAELNGEKVNDYEYVMKIDGSSRVRKYYQMNESSSYGQYATFNPSMFEGETDYVEIFFDVVKDKDSLALNKNYNFKVGIVWVLTDSYLMKTNSLTVRSSLDDVDVAKKGGILA